MESTTSAIGYKPVQETLQESVVRENRTLRSMWRVAGNIVAIPVRQPSTLQLIEEARPSIAMKPGLDAKVDYEYVRNGVVNIFMANEPLKGKRFVEVTEFKTKSDWAMFIKSIADEKYPKAKRITLVMDNYNTHTASAFYETFEPEEAKKLWDRFEFVYTPKHGSWLNMAEIELHVLNGQCLNRHISTMSKIKTETQAWQTNRDNKNCKINWQFTRVHFKLSP